MKDLFKKIGNTLSNLAEKAKNIGIDCIATATVASISTIWIAIMAILNIIYFPYAITYALFIVPSLAVIAATIFLVVKKSNTSVGIYIASNVIAHLMVSVAVIITGNLGIALWYGFPLVIQNMTVWSLVEIEKDEDLILEAV